MVSVVKKYISRIQFAKYKDIYLVGGAIVLLFIIVGFLGSHIAALQNTRMSIADEIKYIESLSPVKVEFLKKHRLINSVNAPAEFNKFIRDFATKNKMKMINCEEKNETTNTGKLRKNLYDIVFLVWHDDSVFDFCDEMHKFTPGFATIKKFNILRIGNVNTKKQSLKVELSCILYYSK
ncbi:MAG: hypothetical protein LBG13_01455 [Holosporales bacterium]|jgi:hypothetical protein|nr:hypothetical protein [Holosporales bacterium]